MTIATTETGAFSRFHRELNRLFRQEGNNMSKNRRRIEIPEHISPDSSLYFAKELFRLNEISSEPIDLVIDSEGGDVNAMFAIIELMRLSPAPIRTICFGKAYSAAATILACGTGGRYALPHSSIMIHGIRINAYDREKFDIPEPDIFLDNFAYSNQRLIQLLSQQTKKSEIEIERAISYDHFMYGEDALTFGLIDGFIEDPSVLVPTRYDYTYDADM